MIAVPSQWPGCDIQVGAGLSWHASTITCLSPISETDLQSRWPECTTVVETKSSDGEKAGSGHGSTKMAPCAH